jgi:hypothetical protein
MRILRLHRSAISCFLLLAFAPACSSWHVGTPTPAEFIARERPPDVRVTRTDGSTVDLTAPEVRGDSVAGRLKGRDTAPYSVPLSDVRSVAVRKTSTGKTLLLVGGVLVGTLLVIYIAECSGASGWEAIGCP